MRANHTLITGASGTGKSTLLKAYLNQRISEGRNAVVYDPIGNLGIKGTISNPEKLFQILSKARDCSVFIDEADTLLSVSCKNNHWLLTRGRHYGFDVTIATQRPQMVAPNVRDQCSQFFIFRSANSAKKMLEDDYACTLPDCQILPAGSFYWGRYADDGHYLVTPGKIF